MNILKEVLNNEVFPALGCTEPIAVAYAASVAAAEVDGDVDTVAIVVDPGVYKNGLAVIVPNTNGQKGNLIAGVLGAFVRQPDLKMEILRGVKKEMIQRAGDMIQAGRATITYDANKTDLHVDVRVKSRNGSARAILAHGHTNLVRLEKNGRTIINRDRAPGPKTAPHLQEETNQVENQRPDRNGRRDGRL